MFIEPSWNQEGFFGDIDDLYPENMDETEDDVKEDEDDEAI